MQWHGSSEGAPRDLCIRKMFFSALALTRGKRWDDHVPRFRSSCSGRVRYTANPAWVAAVNSSQPESNRASKMSTGAVELIECRARFMERGREGACRGRSSSVPSNQDALRVERYDTT